MLRFFNDVIRINPLLARMGGQRGAAGGSGTAGEAQEGIWGSFVGIDDFAVGWEVSVTV